MLWKRSRRAKPDHAVLRSQVAFVLMTFVRIRGWNALLSGGTAAVMRSQFDTFVTSDSRNIENPETVVAQVCVKDTACFTGLNALQSDKSLRDSAFGRLALDQLADQITEQLLQQLESA